MFNVKASQLAVIMSIISADCENHTKYMNTLCEQDVELSNVKARDQYFAVLWSSGLQPGVCEDILQGMQNLRKKKKKNFVINTE